MLQNLYLRLRAALLLALLAACVFAVFGVIRYRLAHPNMPLGDVVRRHWYDAVIPRPADE